MTSQRPSLTNEQWIEWLERVRQDKPDQLLSQLLDAEATRVGAEDAGELMADNQLVDLACIDLILQRRSGKTLPVESIIRQFPILSSRSHLLDLIDAELCIRRELEPARDLGTEIAEYSARFPALTQPIAELIGLSGGATGLAELTPTPVDGSGDGSSQASRASHSPPSRVSQTQNLLTANTISDPSLDMSFSEPTTRSRQGDPHAQQLSHPIELPEWFIGQQCVASDEGRWLIRGRDASSNTTLVMKIIKLPAQIGGTEVDQFLDQCEAAAKVKNPVWIAPSVAAVQDRHLAVIRPWIFGAQWQSDPNDDVRKRLRQLASVAYALAAAHHRGAIHGAVHAGNLLVDHDGQVGLVDASASHAAFHKTLSANASWRGDAQDLVKLAMHEVIDHPGDWSHSLQEKMQQIIRDKSSESCGIIGDELMRRSNTDLHRAPRNSWRSRLSSWIDDRK